MNASTISMPFPVKLKRPIVMNLPLLGLAFSLLLVGIMILASASISVADQTSSDPFFYLSRQLVAVVLGAAAGFICLFLPMKLWQNLGPVMLLCCFALLALVLLPGIGYTVNGSSRWIRLGVMNLQASEPARLCLIIYLAGYLVRQNKSLQEQFSGFFRPMIVLILVCGLLVLEPDLGAAVVYIATAFAMMFVAGARLRDFMLFVVLALGGIVTLALTAEYRLRRLTSFVNPWDDPFDSDFQLSQSLIAVGRGEWFGVGLGNSVQKLFYLPDAHTDFVFAVYAEEFGLLGCALLIALIAALLWQIFKLATHAVSKERFFEAYLAIGIGTWLGLQSVINIGVNLGLLPTKGLTLPFVSYGRSSMIVALASIGILLRIHHELCTDAGPNKARKKRRRVKT